MATTMTQISPHVFINPDGTWPPRPDVPPGHTINWLGGKWAMGSDALTGDTWFAEPTTRLERLAHAVPSYIAASRVLLRRLTRHLPRRSVTCDCSCTECSHYGRHDWCDMGADCGAL